MLNRLLFALFAALIAAITVAPAAASSLGKALSERRFEVNAGQADPRVRFLSRTPNEVWFFEKDGVTAKLGGDAALRLEFLNADGDPEIRGVDPLPGRSHYFVGNDPEKWRSDVAHYARLRYEQAYPGVDLVFYGTDDGRLEYDFIVAPGADPGRIALRFEGPDALEIDASGDLLLDIGEARLRHRKPFIYQEIDGERKQVAGAYRVDEAGVVRFSVEDYAADKPLVVDPVLEYSTYVGGSGVDIQTSIAADDDGAVYLSANVFSADFPTTVGAFDETHGSAPDDPSVAVFKLSPDGSELVFSTFLGGADDDSPRSHGRNIALTSSGEIVVSGHTRSADFPTTPGAYDESWNGGLDIFVSKLDSTGSTLLYSTYIGGSENEERPGLAVDDHDNAYIVSHVKSTDAPTTAGAFDATHNGDLDIYALKLHMGGQGAADLVYATYLGGRADDNGASMTIDADGVIYAVGETESDNFPTTPGAFDTTHNGGASGGGDPGDDLFVFKLDPDPAGSGVEDLLYSTFFGGSSEDDYDGFAPGIAVTEDGDIFFTGETITRPSDDIPFPITVDAIDDEAILENVGGFRRDKVIIARIRPLGRRANDLIYSTYWGGSDGQTQDAGLAYDQNGFLYLAGETEADDFPTLDAVQATRGGGDDGFVSIFGQGGRQLLFSTYLGGEEDELNLSVLPHPTGVFISGDTDSAAFPTTARAFREASAGEADLIVAKISDLAFLPDPIGEVTTVSAASFEAPVAPDAIASAFGEGLARGQAQAMSTPLPTDLGGTSVQIIDSTGQGRLCGLFFVSGAQINFLIPEGLAPGEATVNVRLDGEIVATGTVEIQPIAPSLFTVGRQGTAAATYLTVNPDGSRDGGNVFDADLAPASIDLGPEGAEVYLLMFGTGVRGAAEGSVTATIGGEPTGVLAAQAQGVFVGLDQINIGPIPRSLIGSGEVEVVISVDGAPSNAVVVRIQ